MSMRIESMKEIGSCPRSAHGLDAKARGMQHGRRYGAQLAAALGVVLGLAGLTDAAAAQYEEPPTLKASQVLPPKLRSGPNHKVAENVRNDGYMNHYTLTSPFGELKASSTADLRKKIQELDAVAAMTKIQQSDTYAKSLEASGKSAAAGMKSLATDPVGSLQGAATGIGKLFQQAGEAVAGAPRSKAEGSRTEEMIGFSKTKRDYAHELGVDVYSNNPILQQHLNELAWTGYAGSLTLSAAMALIPGGAGLVVSTSNTTRLLNDVMRVSSPSDLRRMNSEKLRAMGVNEDVADLFVENPNYSPRHQTVIVGALEGMKNAADRRVFVRFAAAAESEDLAYFRQRQAQMYANYERQVAGIERFVPVGRIVGARTREGILVINAPLDYLVWTPAIAALAESANADGKASQGAARKELWVAGKVSPLARKSLEGLGWKVHEDAEARLLAEAPL
jgi:hypothetical protein